jgi:hypothetical protein
MEPGPYSLEENIFVNKVFQSKASFWRRETAILPKSAFSGMKYWVGRRDYK